MMAVVALAQVAWGQNSLAGELAARDSVLFHAALNSCDLKEVEGVFATGFSYERDNGGGGPAATTLRSEFIEHIGRRCTEKRADFQVRRVLVDGSVTVSALGPDMASQTGIQRFYIKAASQPEQLAEESHFTRLWVLENGSWKLSHELDYQILTPSPQDEATHTDSLFKQVTGADSALFAAYNHKDIGPMKMLFARDLEFYHDKGGLSHFDDNIRNFEQKFGDPGFYSRREVDQSSLKVFPLNGYGAIETGVHRFYSMENGKEVLTATANFINTWHFTEGRWQLARVISYDHR